MHDAIEEIRRLAKDAAFNAEQVANNLAAKGRTERAQEALVRTYVMANPEQFPELYRIIQMFPAKEEGK